MRKKPTFFLTIELGFPNTPELLHELIHRAGHGTDDWTNAILLSDRSVAQTSFKIAKPLTLVNLYFIKVKDLDFKSDVTDFSLILKKTKALGLKFCPIEVAPQLCLKYKGRKAVTVIHKPVIRKDDNAQLFFEVWNSNKKTSKLLLTKWGGVENKLKWRLDENLVFMKD